MSSVLINSSDELFDDCPVCQAMKKAMLEERKLSEEELRAAMLKAKEQGGMVGGTCQ